MDDRKPLISSINAFEAMLTKSSVRNDRDFASHKKMAIEQRREISKYRAEIPRLAEQCLESAELRNAFRARFSALCTALALHQALWPVVAIDSNDQGYQASRDAARAKYREFFAWAKAALTTR
ncbi:hypothetical protein [Sphingobium fuliginis]|uniref:hypothetical protein n=1 Tax=Sphingobium fuliginis (strain ATCC 27551) TaxID=336203 RepID=UPI001C3FE999|nr:hypothetical protein [Sphingobium fuliginis]